MSNQFYPSIRKRFIVSFANNFIRSGISFISAIFLARFLGPEDFGRLSFIIASLMAFKQLLDMGSASAFVTFTSQRNRTNKFINTYWLWILIQFLISFLLVAFFIPDIELSIIWKGEERILIILGLIAVFAQNSIWTSALALAESQRKTIPAQKINTFFVALHFSVLILLWSIGKLAIPFIFIAIAIEWTLAGWLVRKLYVDHKSSEKVSFSDIFSEFKIFCLPLIPYAWLGFIHDFADRWMLQHWGGSEEQAYFAVARQFSIVTLLVATSILNIFWKEISEAHYENNSIKVQVLFIKVHRMLYLFGVLVACFLFPWSKEILTLTVGNAYLSGQITFMLMILYPVYQILGQIGIVMLLATNQTRLSTIIGGVAMIFGLIVSYFMLAPSSSVVPGFGLASSGLAWKMLLVQFVQINVLFWFISRLFSVKFEWKYQILSLFFVLSSSYLVKSLLVNFIEVSLITSIIVFSLLYILISLLVLYFYPSSFGWNRSQVNGSINSLSHTLKNLFTKN